jgi:hypothetical protein
MKPRVANENCGGGIDVPEKRKIKYSIKPMLGIIRSIGRYQTLDLMFRKS